jgi:single-strand DNA-binding protein
MNETSITVAGNLVDDPELHYTATGTAVARFRVASTPRYQDQRGQWKDGDTLFLTCNAWRQLGENAAESLRKGMRVLVSGRLTQRSYDSENGKRTMYEVEADDVAPSLRTATATLTKASRSSGTDEAPAAMAGHVAEPPF